MPEDQYITSDCVDTAFNNCNPCTSDSKCAQKVDAECVIYHRDDDKPNKLLCIGASNKWTLEQILEKIDGYICNINGLNTPLTVTDTNSINLTAYNFLNHTLQADVKLSVTSGNVLVINSDGLYVPTPPTAPSQLTYTVTNGLTEAPTRNFKLGGTLLEDTTIDLTTHALVVSATNKTSTFSYDPASPTLITSKIGGYINSPTQSASYSLLSFVGGGSGVATHFAGAFNDLLWSVGANTVLNAAHSFSATESYFQFDNNYATSGGNIAANTTQGLFAGSGTLDKFIGFRAKSVIPYSGGYTGTVGLVIGIQIEDQKSLMPSNVTDTIAINQISPTDRNVFNGAFQLPSANTSIGTATLVAGTVTVTTTAAKTGAHIFLTRNTPGGTLGFLSAPVASIVNNTSFVINSSSNTDTSTVNWWIIQP